ncbi:DNA repair protein RadA [Candidatus Gottesmanbacteria bacterium]|nr:DNA repair protein RadA [Candidatus Gottesmanbacteria bacterium]
MKLKTSFVCQQCGYETPEWYGKCPSCSEWNSFVETSRVTGKDKKPTRGLGGLGQSPVLLSDVKHIETSRIQTGFGEFDRVLGGGIVPGSVTLLSGDPGIGKSTLLLHMIGAVGGLYVSGEESAEQIKLRAHRLGIKGDAIMLLSETNVELIVLAMKSLQENNAKKVPLLVVIDSIQTLQSDELDGMPGTVGQVRASAERITTVAKSFGISVIIIGHVTKDGAIAGPKILEHMVDTVLYLEGERFQNARLLRTLKNRFGAIEEVGIFEMNEKGLKEIDNPSALFLEDRVVGVPGSVITVLLEGTRPILVEIQGLVVSTQLAFPRRVASGFDGNRLQLLVAILQKRLNIPLGTFDIFINVSGGLKVQEPAADIAVSLAILSSFKNIPIDAKSAVFGEVGLLGEVRRVGSEERRIKEAKRLGFTHIISPSSAKSLKDVSKILG